jgi:hypothetical protein
MIEEAYTFGRDGCLIGIVTRPYANTVKAGTPAVVLWNAGLLHHVGPHRFYVVLARRLSCMGFTVLRFDVSGRGDSETRKDSRSHKERELDDIFMAMDFMSAKNGFAEFVLVGLCSGADKVHPAAVLDSRVSGAVLLDAYGYRTWRFCLIHVARRLFNVRKWKKFFAQIYEKTQDNTPSEDIFPRVFPPKHEVRAQLMELMKRGVKLLYIYTGGVQKYYNYGEQFEDMLGLKKSDFQGKLQLEYLKESDHLYTLLNDRDKVLQIICDWFQTYFNCGQHDLLSQQIDGSKTLYQRAR